MQASSPLLLQSLACCFKKQRGLHYKHRDSQSQCFVLHNSKHQRNVLVCFTLITLSCKKRAKGSFSWSWKSNWKERNVKGKKHFSKATLPCARARRNEDENWEGFLLASKKWKKSLNLSVICGIQERSCGNKNDLYEGTKANVEISFVLRVHVAIIFLRTKDFYWIIKF